MVKDPVCGMNVDPKSAAGEAVFEGQTYYFCSAGCRKAFEQDPRKFVHSPKPAGMHHR